MMEEQLKCASFFAGVGGIDEGFMQTGHYETVYANEIDPYPVKTFEANFNLRVDVRDIYNVDISKMPNFDVLLAGFPCQAFSVAGYRKGFEDEKGRGVLFFELMKVVEKKKPSIVFLENVKNLLTHDSGKTFQTILNLLFKENYFVKYAVLNATEYGNVPQNRERVYIVAFKDRESYNNFDFPKPIVRTKKLEDVIDFKEKLDDKYYYIKGKYKGDIYEQLEKNMDTDIAVYQWRRKYVRKNKSGLIPTLTANQGEGGHNVCLIRTKYGIRKMTPKECFLAQGFPKDFVLPSDVPDSKLYKQAGNSVCVTVISSIAENIYDAINKQTIALCS